MIIENLKEELELNEVKDQDKVLKLFSLLKEPINCISPSNPKHKEIRIFHIEPHSKITTTAGKNVIILCKGSILDNDNLHAAIIQKCEEDTTYYY